MVVWWALSGLRGVFVSNLWQRLGAFDLSTGSACFSFLLLFFSVAWLLVVLSAEKWGIVWWGCWRCALPRTRGRPSSL